MRRDHCSARNRLWPHNFPAEQVVLHNQNVEKRPLGMWYISILYIKYIFKWKNCSMCHATYTITIRKWYHRTLSVIDTNGFKLTNNHRILKMSLLLHNPALLIIWSLHTLLTIICNSRYQNIKCNFTLWPHTKILSLLSPKIIFISIKKICQVLCCVLH